MPATPFWRAFDHGINRLTLRTGLANVEIHAKPDVQEQAAAIIDCAARGARLIATTIPSAEALQDAARRALESGTRLISFNSGANLARSIGSLSHVGLDDHAAGEIAGRQFNAAEVDAAVLCVVHNPDNVGLIERCDGLASTFSGEVHRLDLSPASLVESAAATVSIAEAADRHNAGAILVLNDALVASAVAAADGRVVGAVAAGRSFSMQAVLEGDVLFVVNPATQAQVRSLIGFMLTESNEAALSGAALSRFGKISGPAIYLIRPRVLTGELLRIVVQDNPVLLEQLGLVEPSGN